MVELGEIDDGLKLLQAAFYNCQNNSFDIAIIASLLAIAEKRRGNELESDKYLRTAEEADPACPLLRNALSEELSEVRAESLSPAIKEDTVMEFTPLEKQILGWYRGNFPIPALTAQIDNAIVADRQITEEGLFLQLQVANIIPSLEPDTLKQNPVKGPRIIGSEIDSLNRCDLLIRNGRLKILRIFSSGTQFTENLEEFELVDT